LRVQGFPLGKLYGTNFLYNPSFPIGKLGKDRNASVFLSGMDAAAKKLPQGRFCAGNAKGVFYDY
jgi:hypothetical protein